MDSVKELTEEVERLKMDLAELEYLNTETDQAVCVVKDLLSHIKQVVKDTLRDLDEEMSATLGKNRAVTKRMVGARARLAGLKSFIGDKHV